ncbi:MAG: Unknown protein [uncultured Thiotrichaceae bacterium]|uniref:NfeD-like C-terminal domain-containing protein n=1 Tax=uncultured Thiotrichaceae bacterium TaxID=298394 RepID=A0A6S6SMX5_9GAMM|nr:MAG: Unknown protein [uncultured Thiotrichaceae bacterium]
MEDIPFWYWLMVGCLFLVLEILVPGAVIMWFGFAALITGALYWAIPDMPLAAQIMTFAVASAASILGWRFYRSKVPEPESPDPTLNHRLEAFVGKESVLTKAIEHGKGRIQMGDGTWVVLGEDQPKGTRVRIVGLDGIQFQVEAVSRKQVKEELSPETE